MKDQESQLPSPAHTIKGNNRSPLRTHVTCKTHKHTWAHTPTHIRMHVCAHFDIRIAPDTHVYIQLLHLPSKLFTQKPSPFAYSLQRDKKRPEPEGTQAEMPRLGSKSHQNEIRHRQVTAGEWERHSSPVKAARDKRTRGLSAPKHLTIPWQLSILFLFCLFPNKPSTKLCPFFFSSLLPLALESLGSAFSAEQWLA